MPVSPGIRRSSRAASYEPFSRARRAAVPSGQTVTSWPSRGSSICIRSRRWASSSANRIRRPPWCDFSMRLVSSVRLACSSPGRSRLRSDRSVPEPVRSGRAEPRGTGLDRVAGPWIGRLAVGLGRRRSSDGWIGSRTVNVAPWPSPGLVGLDLAVVLADDPVGDRQAQAGPLADLPLGEERLEDVLEHLRRSCRSRCRRRPSRPSRRL